MMELSDIHEELLITIFLQLSAKPLMRFKSVCKSWCHLISSPHFTKLHLNQTLNLTLNSQSNSNLRFVLSSDQLCSADFDTFDHITKHYNPFHYGQLHVVGSCHGLLCLYNYNRSFTIFLYNPTTRTHKKLPFFRPPSDLYYCYCFGFGYDSISEDYKFVRIFQSKEGKAPFKSEVAVYSLKTDSWTRLKNLHHCFSGRHVGVLVDENLHWLHAGFDVVFKHHRVVSFSLSDYSFSEVALPDYYEAEFITSYIGALDGCLCLLANHLGDHLGETDIWVMKEYGVVGSWTRLFRVGKPQDYMFERPIAFSINRRELFLQLGMWRVVSVDLETMVVKDVKVGEFTRCFDTQVCVENLMMLKDAGDRKPKNNRQRGKKRRKRQREQ